MIQNTNELEICKRRLQKLQTWAEDIANQQNKSQRAKEMVLAGVHGMAEQLQQEIQSFERRDYPWHLEDGETYEFCFLRIDIVEQSNLVESNPDELIEDTLNAFAELVDLLRQNHYGKIWSWSGDGGLVAFHIWGRRTHTCEQSVSCAMQILEELAPFNEEHQLEEGGIRAKLAVHSGHAKYRENTGRIYSKAIHSVSHLDSKATSPDTILISQPVYKALNPEQRHKFASHGVFDGMEVYQYLGEDGSAGKLIRSSQKKMKDCVAQARNE